MRVQNKSTLALAKSTLTYYLLPVGIKDLSPIPETLAEIRTLPDLVQALATLPESHVWNWRHDQDMPLVATEPDYVHVGYIERSICELAIQRGVLVSRLTRHGSAYVLADELPEELELIRVQAQLSRAHLNPNNTREP